MRSGAEESRDGAIYLQQRRRPTWCLGMRSRMKPSQELSGGGSHCLAHAVEHGWGVTGWETCRNCVCYLCVFVLFGNFFLRCATNVPDNPFASRTCFVELDPSPSPCLLSHRALPRIMCLPCRDLISCGVIQDLLTRLLVSRLHAQNRCGCKAHGVLVMLSFGKIYKAP